ncbi:MAG: hypothetical protein ACREAA_17000 [Candidatus Polarisedimenticolia bacterium]
MPSALKSDLILGIETSCDETAAAPGGTLVTHSNGTARAGRACP